VVVAGGEPQARDLTRERAQWIGFQAHDALNPRYAERVSQAASRLIDPEAVARVLAARWPGGTTTDPQILRHEIRLILDQHARKGALGPALRDCYRAGWAAGELAADDAVRRAQAKAAPKPVPLDPPRLHHQPAPAVKAATPGGQDDRQHRKRHRERRGLDQLMREAPGAPRGGRSIF